MDDRKKILSRNITGLSFKQQKKLNKAVKNAIILGSGSYSIKYVERIYLKDLRKEEISTAGDSVIQYANWINLKDEKILDSIEAYNKQDCDSTQQLRDFLLNLPEYKELKFATQKVISDINVNLTVDEFNINVLDEEAKKFPIITKTEKVVSLNTVMSNIFGFGGTNAALIFEKV